MSSKSLLKYFAAVAFIFCTANLSAQVENSVVLQDIVEEIAENTDDELDYTTLFNNLEILAENPLDLNTATAEEFREILFLNEYQIYSIIRYRTKYNGFKTIYELAFVEGLDELTMKYLYPFVTIGTEKPKVKTNWKKIFTYGHHTVLGRYQRTLQKKAGYNISDSILAIKPDKSRYLGSPDKYYLKYNYSYKKNISYGFTAEKDEGEQFFRGAQKYGFDFYSAHFMLGDIGILKKVIVGDYVAQFGQGLTMWTGMSFGKGSGVEGVIKKPRLVDKYSSANESAFMRGEAATIKLKDFTITEFVSYKSLDAGIAEADTLTEEEDLVTSFLETGYHRTPNEIAKRHTIKEFVTGGNVTWQGNKLKIGATGVYYSYSNPLNTNDRAYEYFNFNGKSNFNLGVDYLLNLHKINIFGETSMSPNGGIATVDGATIDFVPEFKMSALYRYYSPKYQNMYAQGFSEGNKTYNESGLYIGAEILPVKHLRLNIYFDSWKFPWLKYGVNAPSTGHEWTAEATYTPKRNIEMILRAKYETKQKNSTDDTNIKELINYNTSKYRYQLNITPNDEWKLKSRIEVSRYHRPDSTSWGFLVCEDIQYKPAKLPLTFTARIALFDTQDYNSRIYAYEQDVLYAFTVPMFYGRGTRLALVVKYDVTDNIDLWFRIANSYYADKTVLGSGLDEIQGPNRTEVKLQFRLKF